MRNKREKQKSITISLWKIVLIIVIAITIPVVCVPKLRTQVVTTVASAIGLDEKYLGTETATTNFSVILTASNENPPQDSTIDVYIAIGKFSNIGEGINAFMADLEYDTTKLELTTSNIVSQNNWDTPEYEDGKLLTLKGSMITSQENLIKLTFKVKSTAQFGNTIIKVKNAEAANTTTDFVGEEGTITIKIENRFEVKTYTIKNTYINKISENTKYSDFIKNIDTNMTYSIKESNGTAISNTGLIKTGQVLTVKSTSYTLVVTGDINGDGEVKLSDLSSLKITVLGKTTLSGAYKEAADINGDGEVKLSDLSNLKLKILGKTSL